MSYGEVVVRIQVLGPLSAEVNGGSIVPTAGKPRRILALLALYPKRVMPVPTLTEELWGSRPPPSALTTLQTYILQLRRRLGTAMGTGSPVGAKDVLCTRHGGYVLQIEEDCVDLFRYEKLVQEGLAAFEAGDDEAAATRLASSLALWSGAPLVDVHAGPVLEIEAMRLIAELTDLTARQPHHEGLHAQAMVALYRSGRQASALEIYRRLRFRFIEELGVEPSPQLQRLHQAVLAVDPRLDVLAGPRRTSTFDLFAA
jgi:DNA-binding SARP family transcriptional activator